VLLVHPSTPRMTLPVLPCALQSAPGDPAPRGQAAECLLPRTSPRPAAPPRLRLARQTRAARPQGAAAVVQAAAVELAVARAAAALTQLIGR
jgi:hypothetical protein